jgi:hypothetical protein
MKWRSAVWCQVEDVAAEAGARDGCDAVVTCSSGGDNSYASCAAAKGQAVTTTGECMLCKQTPAATATQYAAGMAADVLPSSSCCCFLGPDQHTPVTLKFMLHCLTLLATVLILSPPVCCGALLLPPPAP